LEEFGTSSLIGCIRDWWEHQAMPRLDWMQIEITTRCNASCRYCPRTVYCASWNDRDLSPAIFRSLLPALRRTRMVHLQGWGEPLLYPHFFDMIALAKKAGCMVGTTTNGKLLDRRAAVRLVESRIDQVAFSLAGVGDQNDEARRGTHFSNVLEAVAGLAAEKKVRRQHTPVISVAYLLLRSHLPDIDKLIPALAGTGIRQIVISTLDFACNENLQKECLAPEDKGQYRELMSLYDRLARDAEKEGISLFYNLADPEAESGDCTENPHRAVFISASGGVSPCAFTNIPVTESYHLSGAHQGYRSLIFGCLGPQSLPEIWSGRAAMKFRAEFDDAPHPSCRGCSKRSRMK